MEARETIEMDLVQKIKTGEISEFAELFTGFIFAGGSAMPKYELLEHFKYLFGIVRKERKDDLALATLKKIWETYHIIEEEAEKKKEHYHLGRASQRANDIFFEFISYVYPTIAWRKQARFGDSAIIMQKTRFWILEYASRRWTQEMTEESYAAFRFLIKAYDSQEKKEILEKILRPRVENWFKSIGLIEGWIMASRREPVLHEIQQLLVMARAKNGGPELAKRDIANSTAILSKGGGESHANNAEV